MQPTGSPVRVFAFTGLVGAIYLGLTILILHLEPTGYNPIRQVVSDYGVGQFATEMSLGFYGGGVGAVAVALAILLWSPHRRLVKVGVSLNLVAGLALFLLGVFPMDLEGGPITVSGGIHSILSLLVFVLGPSSMLLISYAYGRRWFSVTLAAFIIAGAFFAVNGILMLDANGLAERSFILVLLGWSTLVSYHIFRNATGRVT